jgi:hypothetical protein
VFNKTCNGGDHEKPSTRNLRNAVPVYLGLGANDPSLARPALWFRWE